MFLVGHAVVAFLIVYVICRVFKINQGVSLALAMLIGTIPDVDIVTQALGIMPHKTFTHSLIVSVGIGFGIFIATRLGFRQTLAAAIIYALAYLQHLMDDVVIGTLNILYPIGNLPIGIGIPYGSVTHEVVEILLLAIASSIIINQSFRKVMMTDSNTDSIGDDGRGHNTAATTTKTMETKTASLMLFRLFRIDKISYALLILFLIVSFAYLLYEMKSLPRLDIETDLETSLFVLLHLSAIAWVSFTVFVARQQQKSLKQLAR